MKLTLPLSRHNVYRMMRNNWKVSRKRRVVDTNAEPILKKHSLEVIDANEFVAPTKTIFDFSSIVGLAPQPLSKDQSHPMYKQQPCFLYQDDSVLLEGLHQAQVLTNTIQLSIDSLPANTQSLIDTVQLPDQDNLVQRCIKSSCLYDAEQKKLPRRKDPERPAWNFPRDFGISDVRKNRMLCSRLIYLCGLASPEISASRSVLNNVPLSVPLEVQDDLVQLELRSDVFISSEKSLSAIVSPTETDNCSLPELNVAHPLISFKEENIYELKNVFPLKEKTKFNKVHTIIAHYNNTEVKNIFETPVTVSQMMGRSLLKAYTAAIAQARYTYGPTVKDVPEPVVVQCVQTDGKSFHFSVLQLNSADVTSRVHNVYWSHPVIDLYEDCSYLEGVPILEGYNPQVFKYLLAFYVNNS